MQYARLHSVHDILPGIRSRAMAIDRSGNWPAEDLRVLRTIGAFRWAVPIEQGGEDLSAIELHFRYEALASASLTTALILSQRDSAVSLIDGATDWPLRSQTLSDLSGGDPFATVGIAQLTTSRQGGQPALKATPADDGYLLNGLIPWSTGAAKARFIVCGATLPDGLQILFQLPTDLPGILIQPPLQLVALRGSWTTQVLCDRVKLHAGLVLRGPAKNVLTDRPKSLPLSQAFLGMGLCRSAIDLMTEHDSDLGRGAVARIEPQLQQLRDRILETCRPGNEPDPEQIAQLRSACNDLAIRTTHAAVTLYKGTALLLEHPAQRLAREAMFLLVWSCPNPVIDCTMQRLSRPVGS